MKRPFRRDLSEINDISPSGYGSDPIVTIIEEADGSKRTFSQPFSVMQMQRPGVGRWDVSVGEVNNDELRDKPNRRGAHTTTV